MMDWKGPAARDPEVLLALLESESWTVRLKLCQAISDVAWSGEDYPVVREFALAQARDSNKFVRAWALDALGVFAISDEELRPTVLEMIAEALESGPPSVRVRARSALKRLEVKGPNST